MADTTAPSAPGTPTVAAATLTWAAATDDVGVAEYDVYADAGGTQDWASYWYRYPFPAYVTSAIKQVSYLNGQFVVLLSAGSINAVMTSPDGRIWTKYTLPVGYSSLWTSIAYGAGLYVLVIGNIQSNTYYTSPDLVTWTSRTAGSSGSVYLVSVLWTGSLFVVSTNLAASPIYSSPDGITWTLRAVGQIIGGQFAYAGGCVIATNGSGTVVSFTAAGGSAQKVSLSTDYGANWATTGSVMSYAQFLAYGNGMFVGTLNSSGGLANACITSPDGITWTTRTLPVSGYWLPCWTGSVFLLVSSSSTGSNIFLTSPDGITWTQRTVPTSVNGWAAPTAGNSVVLALQTPGGYGYLTSTDGKWLANTAITPANVTQTVLPAALTWSGVAYGNGIYVAVAGWTYTAGNSATATYATSTDGLTWTARTMAAGANGWSGIAYGAGLFVAIIQGGSNCYTSPDGITWTARALPGTYAWSSIVWSGTKFVLVNSSSTPTAYSTDGITWTQATGVLTGCLDVCYGNGLFAAVSPSSSTQVIQTSPDGITWTARSVSTAVALQSIDYDPRSGFFCAITNDGSSKYVVYSPDGATWSQAAVLPTAIAGGCSIVAVPRTGQFFVVSGLSVYYSTPGNPGGTWSTQTIGTVSALFGANAVQAVNGQIVALAYASTTIGYTWSIPRTATVSNAATTITTKARDNAGNTSPASTAFAGVGSSSGGSTVPTTGQLWPR